MHICAAILMKRNLYIYIYIFINYNIFTAEKSMKRVNNA